MLETYEWQRDSMQLPLTWVSHNCSCMPHFHAGVELVYVREGEFSGIINGKPVQIGKKQMLVNSCYAVHSYQASRLDALISVIPMNAVPALKKKLTSCRFSASVVDDDAERTLFQFMTTLKRFPDNKHLQCGLSEALLGYLIERVGLDELDASDHSSLLCRILMYLNEHFREPLTVEILSEQFGYSRSRFSHLFKANLGYSLPRYLNTLRVRHAAELLLSTDLTVTQIALESGFNNTHTFYSAFRSVYDQTPAEYIRAQSAAVTAVANPRGEERLSSDVQALASFGFDLCMPPAED